MTMKVISLGHLVVKMDSVRGVASARRRHKVDSAHPSLQELLRVVSARSRVASASRKVPSENHREDLGNHHQVG